MPRLIDVPFAAFAMPLRRHALLPLIISDAVTADAADTMLLRAAICADAAA